MESSLVQEINQLHAKICSGLADPNRILILYALAEQPHTVNALAESLEIPQPRVSRHLKVLRECNLAQATRDGQSVIYTLKDERVIEALDILRSVLSDVLENQASLIETLSS